MAPCFIKFLKFSKGTVFPCIHYCDCIQKSVTLKKLWHILNILVFLLVGGTSKNSGTYLKYSYGWRLVAGDLGGATRGCCATQTLSAKPLILSHLYFASKL